MKLVSAIAAASLVAILGFLAFSAPASADEVVFPPKLAGCGPSLTVDPLWNEKVFGLTTVGDRPYFLNSVRIIVAGSRSVRVQVGPRNFSPVLDVVLEDFVQSPPFDITRNLGAISLPSGDEVVIRVACVDGQFPNDTALATVILGVSAN